MISKYAGPDILIFQLFGFMMSLLAGISISSCMLIYPSISSFITEYFIKGYPSIVISLCIGSCIYYLCYTFSNLKHTIDNPSDHCLFYMSKEFCINIFTSVYISIYLYQITSTFFILLSVTGIITGLIRIIVFNLEKYLWTPQWFQKKTNS